MKCLRGFLGYRRPPKRPVGMLVYSDAPSAEWIAATPVDVLINIVWSGQW